MKVIVIGAGLAGLTSAYFLRKAGNEVAVVDRAAGPGLETSFANASLLTPSMSGPWNTPGSWRPLMRSLLGRDAPLSVSPRVLPSLLPWGLRFLRNSSWERYRRAALANLTLAQHSLDVLKNVQVEERLEFGRISSGSLRIFRTQRGLEDAVSFHERTLPSITARVLSPIEIVDREPALRARSNDLAGGIFYAEDETADAYRFCAALAARLKDLDVRFHFGVGVAALSRKSDKILGLETDSGRLRADRYVLAAGSHSVRIARTANLEIPVRPCKGYSVSVELRNPRSAPGIPIVDDERHTVAVGLGSVLRLAGGADFVGNSSTLATERVQELVRLARTLLPEAEFDEAGARSWCGLRAMSADGVSIIGATSVSNLFVNTGHGHLGWTMAAGSGRMLADTVMERPSAIDATPYGIARFKR